MVENNHKNNTMHEFHGKNLRKNRCSLPHYCYLLTTVTHNRRPIFSDFYAARFCIHGLRLQQERGLAMTMAFVVMPDHVHWLVQLQQGSLATIMHSMKGGVARRINLYRGTSSRIWQRGYYDHALRREEDIRQVARYIVANPLRAGLVSDIRHYPHRDAVWME